MGVDSKLDVHTSGCSYFVLFPEQSSKVVKWPFRECAIESEIPLVTESERHQTWHTSVATRTNLFNNTRTRYSRLVSRYRRSRSSLPHFLSVRCFDWVRPGSVSGRLLGCPLVHALEYWTRTHFSVQSQSVDWTTWRKTAVPGARSSVAWALGAQPDTGKLRLLWLGKSVGRLA